MHETVGNPAEAGRVVTFPSLANRDSVTVRQLADAYAVAYTGHDHAKLARVEWRAAKLGDVPVRRLEADQIADLLGECAKQPVMRYRGRHGDGKPIIGPCGKRKNSTVNGMRSTLGSMITVAKDRRLLPRAHLASGAQLAHTAPRCFSLAK